MGGLEAEIKRMKNFLSTLLLLKQARNLQWEQLQSLLGESAPVKPLKKCQLDELMGMHIEKHREEIENRVEKEGKELSIKKKL